MKTEDLPNFLRKRPHLFTFKMDHVWSKFDSIENLHVVEEKKAQKSEQNEPESSRKLFLGYLDYATTEDDLNR